MTADKRLLRLASAIHAELAVQRGNSSAMELPERAWKRCSDLVRRSRRAELRNWHLAAAELRRDLAYELTSLQSELTVLASQFPRVPLVKRVASAGDIYGDIVALAGDFAELDFDLQARRLSITTEPITLQNLYLGPFEIRLRWSRLNAEPSYRVVAVDPHPAESRDNVIHPHVMDEQLCEGESHVAIREAMTQGRLLDFFTLVANGLRSYNADSPFVAIEVWCGGSCSDCGYALSDEDGYTCDKCDESVCNDCEVTCCGCDCNCCSRCTLVCSGCDDSYCRGCVSPCSDCHQRFCSQCLHEDERCPNCHDQQLQAEAAEASVEIQSHGLGEAPVSAGCG